MNAHHLVLGQLADFLTGRLITDTHDERYRQKIARWLVERKGYSKSEISAQFALQVRAGTKCALVPIAFVVTSAHRMLMVVHYGPGSLVTRRRPALAMSRLAAPYQIPVVVVSNGEDAEILDGTTGQVTAAGLDGIPEKTGLLRRMAVQRWTDIPPDRAQGEARILVAYEVDDRCPCDDTTCLLEGR